METLRRTLALGALAAVGLALPGADQAAKRPKPCPAAKSVEVSGPIQTQQAVLYERVKGDLHSLRGCDRNICRSGKQI